MGLVESDKEIYTISEKAYVPLWCQPSYVNLSHGLLFLIILYFRVKYGLNLKNILVKVFSIIVKIERYKK